MDISHDLCHYDNHLWILDRQCLQKIIIPLGENDVYTLRGPKLRDLVSFYVRLLGRVRNLSKENDFGGMARCNCCIFVVLYVNYDLLALWLQVLGDID